jgi:hypothetical protein
MPADGVLDIDLACWRGSLRISLTADRTTIVARACRPSMCVAPEGLRTKPIACAAVPTSAGGVR